MLVKQISVFLENRKGRLAEATQILSDQQINISALSIAETADYGVLRLIVNKPDEAFRALQKNGFTVKETEVIAIVIDHTPGGLNRILKILDEADVSVEYIYAFVTKHYTQNQALAAFKVEDNQKALLALQKASVEIAKAEEIYQLSA